MAIKIGLGIDAGGTYTDAVLYSFEENKILGAAKALTTKDDLSLGIGGALDGLPQALLPGAECVALSTTLATNACVEDKGGRGRLIMIGVDERVVHWVGQGYGLPPLEEIRLVERPVDGEPLFPSNGWQSFLENNREWFRFADGVAVVDIFAGRNSAAYEKELREWIQKDVDLPVICGYELSSDLNSLLRGSGALLNVRLIPVIREFLDAVKKALTQRGVNAPVSITRSDGSLMSESFTKVRPVETLLCGPAAGLIGGAYMTGEADCLVIDMGGTTTDISIVNGGTPQKAEDGINIGKYRTFVKGAFVDTFGLGGDSVIRLDKNGVPCLEAWRAMPLCMAGDKWPKIKEDLEALVESKNGHTRTLQEFLLVIRDISKDQRYTAQEREFCLKLGKEPVIFSRAAELGGLDVYNLNVDRLEREGVIIRCGLTPTDIMHIKGDFTKYDGAASSLGARFVAAGAGISKEELADVVYETVKKTLYKNIVRVLLQSRNSGLPTGELGPETSFMIEQGWKDFRGKGKGFLKQGFHSSGTLVGIGAPIHIFLPDVAEALSAKWVVPQNAEVANALGAVVGRVETVCRVEVRPVLEPDGFEVLGPYERFFTEDKALAFENALEQSQRGAREEALRRGINGELEWESHMENNECFSRYGSEIYLGSWAVTLVRGSAYGSE